MVGVINLVNLLELHRFWPVSLTESRLQNQTESFLVWSLVPNVLQISWSGFKSYGYLFLWNVSSMPHISLGCRA